MSAPAVERLGRCVSSLARGEEPKPRGPKGGEILAEVGMIVSQLKEGKKGEEINLRYVRQNELSATIEAVTRGHIAMTTQEWDRVDGDFCAFERSLTGMMERAVEASSLMGFDGEHERRRRQVELEEQYMLRGGFYNGEFNHKVAVMLSPFPEEMGEWGSDWGYDGETRRAMIRVHQVDEEGRKQITQIAIENSQLEAFKRLLVRLGVEEDVADTTEVMRASCGLLVEKASETASVVRLAEMYDDILENIAQEGSRRQRYFLGREVGENEQKDYEELERRRLSVEGDIQPFVEELVEFDVALAESLMARRPTGVVAERAWKLLTPVLDKNGAQQFLVSEEERKILQQGLLHFDERAAKILKQKVQIRLWATMAAVVNEERARKVLGEVEVDEIQAAIRLGRHREAGFTDYVDVVVAQSRISFSNCSGSFGGGGLYGAGEVEASDILFGDSELFVWRCERCGRKHNINVPKGEYKERCEGCGASGRC